LKEAQLLFNAFELMLEIPNSAGHDLYYGSPKDNSHGTRADSCLRMKRGFIDESDGRTLLPIVQERREPSKRVRELWMRAEWCRHYRWR